MSRISRLLKIAHIACRYRLDEFIDTSSLPLFYKTILRLSPTRLWQTPNLSRGARLRLALEELGPIFIKFGQMLSTRRDLLPDDIADELAKLQDDVPPFPEQVSVTIIEKALGKSVDQLFADFESTPMASASVAQIHKATLHSGEKVVVKVVRPDIEPVIRQDIALMHTLAKLAFKHLPNGRRLRPTEVVSDYELTILDELDMGREAANASQLRRNFADSKLLYVPEVYWDYTCKNVFVMERISGIAVTDLTTLKTSGADLKLLAERGVEIFFTQVFRDSFFHADMHPGNIFIDISDPADPTYIAVDCAIIGSLSDSDQYYLARVLLGIFQRDYRAVAQLHVECGWVPANTRVQDFESAMRAVCEPIFERPISEISFGQLLVYLFQTAGRFDMEVQPSLVLLQKTLLNIEGLGRQLYPELNLWDTAQPYLEEWVRDRYSPQSVFKQLQRHAPSWLEQLPQLPDAILESLQNSREIDQAAMAPMPLTTNTTLRNEDQGPSRKRLTGAVILIGCAIVTATPGGWQQLAETPPLAWILAACGTALLLSKGPNP
ncbi:MAG: ubiquinone biosynthesis regulatory protein kinase UbiB [Halioglobus sp.]